MKYLSTVILFSAALPALAQTQNYSDQDIINSYHYMLGRHLILKQEQDDFKKGGFSWNKLIHRPVAEVKAMHPNLDVALSEAWMAVDENSCAMLDVPAIQGRYYTVQTVNGWGEVTSNINERTFPKHPAGKFAYCLSGNKAEFPKEVQRIDLPSQKSRLLVRVEIGKDKAEAVKLQKTFKLAPSNVVKVDKNLEIKPFTLKKLPGVEIFDKYQEVLMSEKDINPGMEGIQSTTDLIGRGTQNKTERRRIDTIVRKEAIPAFMNALKEMPSKNGWMRPKLMGNYGGDYLTRSLVNYSDLWTNSAGETYTFTAVKDSEGLALDGKETYTMTFPANEAPETLARYFWSILAVDKTNFRVIANPLKKYLVNNLSNIQKSSDGSLTLYFSPEKPVSAPLSNWIPTVKGKKYDLRFRYWGPAEVITKGEYFPPALIKTQSRISKAK
mgnify:CR=1 FL=1